MEKKLVIIVFGIFVFLITAIISFNFSQQNSNAITDIVQYNENPPNPTIIPKPKLAKEPKSLYSIPMTYHVYQTFNNCGPATLAMVMNYWGSNIDQQTLGLQMRPHQNTSGINDDKSVFAAEFIPFSKKYGYETIIRPNGTIELLKRFITNDIPIVVRTWLHPNEDIGHFRIVRGFDETDSTIIQNDSYEGKDIKYGYDTFLDMWEPFNYGYIVVYPFEKHELVLEILGNEKNEMLAWENSITRATTNIPSSYSLFNQSVANYYLGDYQKAVTLYEQVEKNLSSRMLWYQLEPILAYQKIGNNDRVLSLIDTILFSGNGGFAELYQIRGEVYQSLGKNDLAKSEFEKAYFYNSNIITAKEKADELSL